MNECWMDRKELKSTDAATLRTRAQAAKVLAEAHALAVLVPIHKLARPAPGANIAVIDFSGAETVPSAILGVVCTSADTCSTKGHNSNAHVRQARGQSPFATQNGRQHMNAPQESHSVDAAMSQPQVCPEGT